MKSMYILFLAVLLLVLVFCLGVLYSNSRSIDRAKELVKSDKTTYDAEDLVYVSTGLK